METKQIIEQIKLLAGQMFKLDFDPNFHFPVPRARCRLPFPRFCKVPIRMHWLLHLLVVDLTIYTLKKQSDNSSAGIILRPTQSLIYTLLIPGSDHEMHYIVSNILPAFGKSIREIARSSVIGISHCFIFSHKSLVFQILQFLFICMKLIDLDPFWALHVRTGNTKNHSRPIQGRLF